MKKTKRSGQLESKQLVDEVRAIRKRLWAKHGDTVAGYVKHLQEMERQREAETVHQK